MNRSTKSARDEIDRLWGLSGVGRPGPKAGLTPRMIAQTAIEIADETGMAGVSMRRIADRLKASAMALYVHVPSKSALLEIMVDEAASQINEAPSGSWEDRVRFIAGENLRLYASHPWLLFLDDYRPVLGPNIIRKYELELRAFEGLGLQDWEMDAALESLLALIKGFAHGLAAREREREGSSLSDADWWAARQPLLAPLELDRRFPLASRVGASVGARANEARAIEDGFEFGLQCWLRGLEILLNREKPD